MFTAIKWTFYVIIFLIIADVYGPIVWIIFFGLLSLKYLIKIAELTIKVIKKIITE